MTIPKTKLRNQDQLDLLSGPKTDREIQNIFYHPPTKLREGNVFTGVSLFVRRMGFRLVTITHDTLEVTVQGPPPPDMGPVGEPPPPLVTSGGYPLRPVQTCSLDNVCCLRSLLWLCTFYPLNIRRFKLKFTCMLGCSADALNVV